MHLMGWLGRIVKNQVDTNKIPGIHTTSSQVTGTLSGILGKEEKINEAKEYSYY